MKKTSDDELTLELTKNPDILKGLCERKQNSPTQNKPIIIGFCAESENLIENAKTKIAQKGCDYLIANDISRKISDSHQMITKFQFWIKMET